MLVASLRNFAAHKVTSISLVQYLSSRWIMCVGWNFFRLDYPWNVPHPGLECPPIEPPHKVSRVSTGALCTGQLFSPQKEFRILSSSWHKYFWIKWRPWPIIWLLCADWQNDANSQCKCFHPWTKPAFWSTLIIWQLYWVLYVFTPDIDSRCKQMPKVMLECWEQVDWKIMLSVQWGEGSGSER